MLVKYQFKGFAGFPNVKLVTDNASKLVNDKTVVVGQINSQYFEVFVLRSTTVLTCLFFTIFRYIMYLF